MLDSYLKIRICEICNYTIIILIEVMQLLHHSFQSPNLSFLFLNLFLNLFLPPYLSQTILLQLIYCTLKGIVETIQVIDCTIP